jgi:hypothetical protein
VRYELAPGSGILFRNRERNGAFRESIAYNTLVQFRTDAAATPGSARSTRPQSSGKEQASGVLRNR